MAGWNIDGVLSRPDRGDGFDANVFRSATGQIVIAFRGTDGLDPKDWDDNIQIGGGFQSEQVAHAIEVVADVLEKFPTADIQFTGRSLGGGLASLMSVYFERPAYIFAPAPLENSAVDRLVSLDQGHASNQLIERYSPTIKRR